MDNAGPLFVQGMNNISNKDYICLFTCASVRAVHLELVEKLTTTAFIRALRRFISRRGMPEVIISDNAKNFQAASKELVGSRHLSGSEEYKNFVSDRGKKWHFIVERASWWGGFYERLIALVKRCIKKTLGQTSLSYVELNSMLTEVEAVLSSRPLTYTYPHVQDGPPLTPSHFLCGYRILSPLLTNQEDQEYYPPEEHQNSLTL